MIHNPYSSLYRYKAPAKKVPMPPGHPRFHERLMFEKEFIELLMDGDRSRYTHQLSLEAMEESQKWLKTQLVIDSS